MLTVSSDVSIKAATGCLHRPFISCLSLRQVLWGTLAAGQEKEGELATRSLEFEFHLQFTCDSLLTELSVFHQSAQSGNKCECKQTLKNMLTNVISTNQHHASTFSMQIFKFQRQSCKVSFLFPPCHQIAPERLLQAKAVCTPPSSRSLTDV